MMWGYGDYGGGWSWIMLGTMVLGWGGLLAVIVWAIYRVFPGQARGSESAAEILDRRFASGEIDTETYRAALRELGASRSIASRDAF
ncbi:MAG: SHOCT domain-containing protein [Candidatus Nanopelagicales bacterium]|nr:SHOCT domain-containing protein [Candidatus Nanopelagicales bacterium]